jgi:hypothetical protein
MQFRVLEEEDENDPEQPLRPVPGEPRFNLSIRRRPEPPPFDPARPVQWIPGHCVRSNRIRVQMPDCPQGYVWRTGHYRRMPTVEQTHKFLHQFTRELRHVVARHPNICPQPFQNFAEFKDCLKWVVRSLKSYLLKNPYPSRRKIKKYIDHLVNRVIYCTGLKLQNQCYFQPTAEVRKYIERHIERRRPRRRRL